MSAEERAEVKRQVAVANRVLAELGLATGVLASLGHASMRLPSEPDKFVVKGRGYAIDALARMRPEDMVVCDLDGYLVDGPPGVSQCFEVKMHSCIYRARPDVQSVVHVHPRFVVVMSVLEAPLVPMCQEGIDLVRHPLPVYPHVKTIHSEEEGQEVARLLGNHKAIILRGHGATTTGSTLAEAVMNMLFLEEQAKMNWYAYCAAGPQHPRISDALIEEIHNRPRLEELPHFQGVLTGQREVGLSGVWKHYADLVSRDL
ncbi:MAG TPA: class II aldolase/adducin family protein [Candidatus Dormibacteraeota bacterium]|nr:class II aldolase/adducin family protein [Candidatus Dormibacteraeota bacterium]